MSAAKILIKLPSRERPDALREALSRYATMCTNKADTKVMLTLDDDNKFIEMDRDYWPAFIPRPQPRSTKIGATNRDLPGAWPWDILVVASDDMWPIVHGYDDIIRKDMAEFFPDGDGALWYSDGRQNKHCTMPIMGRKYFDRFGYAYEPGYKSYHCDVEFTKVAQKDHQLAYIEDCLFQHEHPCFRGKVPEDDLYKHNRMDKSADLLYYLERERNGFPCPAPSSI